MTDSCFSSGGIPSMWPLNNTTLLGGSTIRSADITASLIADVAVLKDESTTFRCGNMNQEERLKLNSTCLRLNGKRLTTSEMVGNDI